MSLPRSIPTDLAGWLAPDRAALLVYDMQVGIARQLPGAAAWTERCVAAVAAARAAGLRVAFCRHLSLPRPWMGTVATRMAMAWQRTDDPDAVTPWFLRDGDAVAIVPELTPRPEDIVFDKLAMSAFEGTWLASALRDAGLDTLVLCGIAMEIGIEPTCRHAADLGFVPVVIADACGHGDADAAARSLESLRFAGDTIVTDLAGFSAALASA